MKLIRSIPSWATTSLNPTASQPLLSNERKRVYNSRRWLECTGVVVIRKQFVFHATTTISPSDSQWVGWPHWVLSHIQKKVSGFLLEQLQDCSSYFMVTACVWSPISTSLLLLFHSRCDRSDVTYCENTLLCDLRGASSARDVSESLGGGGGAFRSLTQPYITSPHVCFQLASPPPPCLGSPLWHQKGGAVSHMVHTSRCMFHRIGSSRQDGRCHQTFPRLRNVWVLYDFLHNSNQQFHTNLCDCSFVLEVWDPHFRCSFTVFLLIMFLLLQLVKKKYTNGKTVTDQSEH